MATLQEKCLERSCKDCNDSCFIINEFEDGTISYYQSKTLSVDVEIKQQMKKCKNTIKEEINLTKRELVHLFCSKMLEKCMKHIKKMKHQFSVTKQIKNGLKANDILIHCDFSENYSCKLVSEVQSTFWWIKEPSVSAHCCCVFSRHFFKFNKTPILLYLV